MGIHYQEYYTLTLKRHTVYRCGKCHTDLLLPFHIISNNFHGEYGPGYLVEFTRLLNVEVVPPHLTSHSSLSSEDDGSESDSDNTGGCMGEGVREVSMKTGRYLIVSIQCALCKTKIGWKYLKAVNSPDQIYKEGKCLVERTLINLVNGYTDTDRFPSAVEEEDAYVIAEMARARSRMSITAETGHWMDVERRLSRAGLTAPIFTSRDVSDSFVQVVNLGFPARRHIASRSDRIRHFLEYSERGPVRFEDQSLERVGSGDA